MIDVDEPDGALRIQSKIMHYSQLNWHRESGFCCSPRFNKEHGDYGFQCSSCGIQVIREYQLVIKDDETGN